MPSGRGDREHTRLLTRGVGGRRGSDWLAISAAHGQTARRTDFREMEQEDAADLRHGLRIALHGMAGAHDELGFNPVDVRALIGHDTIVAGFDRTVTLHSDNRVGGDDAVLVVDDTALLKKGSASVGVAPLYCG